MSKIVQRRRGTTAEHTTFTGAVAELTVDTTKDTVVVHDGAAAGGFPLLREDGSNSALAIGSAGTPSLKFTGDSNTGLYSPGADQAAISTAGTERARIDSSGRLLVGTSSTSASISLLLQGTPASATGALGLARTANNPTDGQGLGQINFSDSGHVAAAFVFAARDGGTWTSGVSQPSRLMFSTTADGASSPTERLRITSAGNVGIGTSAPNTILETNVASGNNEFRQSVAGVTRGQILSSATDQYIANLGTGAQQFWNLGGERMRITSAGNVGIGTSSPSNTLHCQATTTSSDLVYFYNQGATGSDVLRLNTEGVGSGTTVLDVQSAGTSRLVVLGTGNVGIGTTSPTAALTVQGELTFKDSSGAAAAQLGAISSTFRIQGQSGLNLPLTFWTVDSERARIDSSGRLLVGTSTARANYFNSTGTAQFQIEGLGSAAATASITCNRSLTAATATLALNKSAGDAVGSNTLVPINDSLGVITFQGSDGTEFVQAASIAAFTDGTPGANDMPGRLVFSTTADGAASPTERMRITSAGVLQIADAGNIAVGTTTGTKIGTATTQKLGFYNATPVVQPTAVADATDAASVITQLNALLARMRDLGLIAT